MPPATKWVVADGQGRAPVRVVRWIQFLPVQRLMESQLVWLHHLRCKYQQKHLNQHMCMCT